MYTEHFPFWTLQDDGKLRQNYEYDKQKVKIIQPVTIYFTYHLAVY